MYFSKLHSAFNNLRTSFKWLVGFPGGSNSKEVKWSEVKVAQLCPTLCDPMGCSPWNSPGQNTGVGSLSFFQRIFLTQESNQGLLHCRWILYQLSWGKPQNSKESVCSSGDPVSWVGKIPWRRIPWTEEPGRDCKESDTTEQLSFTFKWLVSLVNIHCFGSSCAPPLHGICVVKEKGLIRPHIEMGGGVWLVCACLHPWPPPWPWSAFLCVLGAWSLQSLSPRPPGWMTSVGSVNGNTVFGRWKVGAFLPCSLPALVLYLWLGASMMAADTTPALHWLWLIISGPFSFVGRKLPVSGCLTVHCCSLNSDHASGNSILAKSLYLTISAACQALEDSTVPLHRPPSLLKGGLVLWLLLFPVFVTETWWTQRLLSLSLLMPQCRKTVGSFNLPIFRNLSLGDSWCPPIFEKVFFCGPFLVFIEFVTVLLLFYVSIFSKGMWDLSFPARDQNCTSVLTTWTPRKSLYVRKYYVGCT